MSNQFDRALAELGAPAPQNRPFRQSVYRQAAYANQKAAIKAAKTRSKTEKKTQTRAPKTREKVQTRAPKTREKVQTREPKDQNQDSWRSSYQTATAESVAAAQATYNPDRVQTRAPLSRQGAATGGSDKDAWRTAYQTATGGSSQSTASGMTATRAGAKQPLTQTRPGMFTTGKTGKGAAPAGGKDLQVSKVFGKGPLAKARGRRPGASGSPSLGGRLSEKYLPAMASMDSFQGMPISTSPQGFSYPEIPQQVAQEVPNYYAMSRQARGLPPLPPESGNNDHEIAQFLVEKVQVDADKRRTVEETIYTILSAAAQSAGQAKDAEQARVLMGYANRWVQAIQKAQQTPAPQQSADQNDQGETSGFSLTEWVQDSSNTRWMIAFGLFSLAAGLHFYQKQGARSRVVR